MPNQAPLPLSDIRVLDATHIVAGPFCSQILADMGAEVIKIERPRTGDLVRGRGPYVTKEDGRQISSRYIGLNRNKKSVTLDLRNSTCKAAFEEMVKVSDVLLDNWGPGAFQRLGLGYEHLREMNPGLIYASITGYGDSDQLRGPYSNWPANNLAIQAMAGWMELTGEPGRPPQSVGDNIGDSIPGVWAALGVVLALRSREQTGQGQHVDLSMYECMAVHTLSNMYGYQATGEVYTRDWSRLAQAGITLRASDGYVVMAGARVRERWSNLWRLVGREDLADNPNYLAPGDGDFIHDHVVPALEEWSRNLPKWEVAGRITELGFSMGVAQDTSDMTNCPQLEVREMFVETGDTAGGTFRSLRTPVRLLGCADIDPETAPALGQHNREILCTLGGLTEEDLSALEEEGAV